MKDRTKVVARNGRRMNRLKWSKLDITYSDESRDWKEEEDDDSIRDRNDEFDFTLPEIRFDRDKSTNASVDA